MILALRRPFFIPGSLSMRLKVNGKPEEFEKGTVQELLISKKIEPRMVSVELNSKILERKEFETSSLKEGDVIEFLYFMGGGK
jgi:sulfur carrier protein